MTPATIDELQSELAARRYFAERGLAAVLFLALKLERPVLLEGEAGVGKTEVAKVLADLLDTELIRLQCYEGIDSRQAIYEWNYARQLLHLRLAEARGEQPEERDLFGREFLLARPLLRALEAQPRPVLLVDEIDRSDEEFEAYLLEFLSDFQISIPELGTIRAERPPVVILTSNRTREIHEALKRRCIYHWIDYPSFDDELAIVRAKVPGASESLSRQVAAFVQELRRSELWKVPGLAETLDWAAALTALDARELDADTVDATLGFLLKYQDDLSRVRGEHVKALVDRARLVS